eukprot:283185-Ditylum_brightwellii.AAC.1
MQHDIAVTVKLIYNFLPKAAGVWLGISAGWPLTRQILERHKVEQWSLCNLIENIKFALQLEKGRKI